MHLPQEVEDKTIPDSSTWSPGESPRARLPTWSGPLTSHVSILYHQCNALLQDPDSDL
jgi:hypothetical protein